MGKETSEQFWKRAWKEQKRETLIMKIGVIIFFLMCLALLYKINFGCSL